MGFGVAYDLIVVFKFTRRSQNTKGSESMTVLADRIMQSIPILAFFLSIRATIVNKCMLNKNNIIKAWKSKMLWAAAGITVARIFSVDQDGGLQWISEQKLPLIIANLVTKKAKILTSIH